MDITSTLPEPVQWSEGMLLGPQHLQQHDVYWQQQLRHQMGQLQPWYWGLIDLKIDEGRLRQGEVRVERVQAVMPDGLVVQFPAPGQEDVLSLNLSDRPEWKEQRAVKVYLAVPAFMEGTANERFYAVSGALEVDVNTGEGRVPVPRLRARPSLLPEDRLAPKFVAIPLLELRRDLGGSFALTEFHPPLLRTRASAFLKPHALHDAVTGFAERLRDKIRELSGARVDGSGAGTQGLVRPLAAALPPLEVMAHGGNTHPFDLYMALAHVVGHLAAVGTDPVPLLMEPYRHDDAMPGFSQALAYAGAVLERLRVGYEALPLERAASGAFQRSLPDGGSERIVIALRAQPGQTREALALWAKQAIIGADTVLPTLRQRRLLGAERRILRPDELPEVEMQGTSLLLEVRNTPIEVNGKEVPVMQAGRALHVEGGDAGAPAAVVFYRENRAAQPPARRTGGNGRG